MVLERGDRRSWADGFEGGGARRGGSAPSRLQLVVRARVRSNRGRGVALRRWPVLFCLQIRLEEVRWRVESWREEEPPEEKECDQDAEPGTDPALLDYATLAEAELIRAASWVVEGSLCRRVVGGRPRCHRNPESCRISPPSRPHFSCVFWGRTAFWSAQESPDCSEARNQLRRSQGTEKRGRGGRLRVKKPTLERQ